MLLEQRYTWGRAYRDGELVCARVHLIIGRDGRLGLARHERRYVAARFLERLQPALRAELAELARRRGAAARRAAERMDPIEIVFTDRRLGTQRIVGWVQPPAGALRRVTRDRVRSSRAPSVSDEPRRLTGDEIMALKFAAHRQLARLANKRDELQPRQRARRAALVRAVRILEDKAFADGCELRATDDG
jgi:hypothetical protein